jgi:hypothetical protein
MRIADGATSNEEAEVGQSRRRQCGAGFGLDERFCFSKVQCAMKKCNIYDVLPRRQRPFEHYGK